MSRYVKACSRTVHEVFGKDHKNVLQKIDSIIKDDEDDFGEDSECLDQLKFQPVYFIESAYRDDRNRMRREFLLTKDGFTIVAMRFSGKKALKFQTAYIRRYNEMEKYIKNLNSCRVGYPDLT